MTDETDERVIEEQADAVSKLRDEMNEQFQAMRQSFETTLAEKDAQIAELQKNNETLNRALVRSAQMDPPKTEPVKTEQDLYDEAVRSQAERTLKLMRERL